MGSLLLWKHMAEESAGVCAQQPQGNKTVGKPSPFNMVSSLDEDGWKRKEEKFHKE